MIAGGGGGTLGKLGRVKTGRRERMSTSPPVFHCKKREAYEHHIVFPATARTGHFLKMVTTANASAGITRPTMLAHAPDHHPA